jgi:Flp pilus assembly protein TadB
MNEKKITTREQLDATLEAMAESRRQRLWKAAEGNSVPLSDVIAGLFGGILCAFGVYGVLTDQNLTGVLFLFLGMFLVMFMIFRMQQVQIDALRKLLRSKDA